MKCYDTSPTTICRCSFWWTGKDCLRVNYKSSAFIGIMVACGVACFIVLLIVVVAFHSKKKGEVKETTVEAPQFIYVRLVDYACIGVVPCHQYNARNLEKNNFNIATYM